MKYLVEIVKKNNLMVGIYLISGIMLAFFNNFSASYFQKLIDQFNNGTLSRGVILIYSSVLVILVILNYVDEYPGRRIEHGIYYELKLKALEKMSEIDYLAYQKMGTGTLIQRIENGADAGKSILFDYYFCLVRELLPSIIFSMLFIYSINQKIMVVIMLGYVIVFIITNLLLKVLYQMKECILTNEEKMNYYLVRGFMEMVTFRMNKQFEYEIKKATKAKKKVVSSKVKMAMIHEAFFTIFALIVTILKIVIIIYGWQEQSLSIGKIVALITLIDNAYTPIAIFNVLFVQFKLDKTAFLRYSDFLNEREDVALNKGVSIPKFKGSIELESLKYSYENRVIFKKLDLHISYGEHVAFVGESGSGKSTLIKLITGLLKPSFGSIRVGGNDLSVINLNSYYSNIVYVPQESSIFDGNIRENLSLNKIVEDEILLRALEKVELKEWFSKLKKGFDTELGERGITLSGGEKQRLALARLWLIDASLVILDEATSAMDNITEEIVMKNVNELLFDRTVIVIAHRLNSIRSFQRIITIKDGTILDEGNFEYLLAKSEYFRNLYNASVPCG